VSPWPASRCEADAVLAIVTGEQSSTSPLGIGPGKAEGACRSGSQETACTASHADPREMESL
jgi:hypothetical protein